MKELIKYVWRCFKSMTLKHNDVFVSPQAIFNRKTVFEGHNVIQPNTNVSNSFIGRNTYIGRGSKLVNCKIGRFCSIAPEVEVIRYSHPIDNYVSTCPSFFSTRLQNGQTFVKQNKYIEHMTIDGYDVIIGNDVWIGNRAIIKGGIKIGDGAIVGMGSIVTKDVPPYTIVAGVPAKVIRNRFEEKQVNYLLSLQWWNQTDDWIIKHADEFENIDIFMESNN